MAPRQAANGAVSKGKRERPSASGGGRVPSTSALSGAKPSPSSSLRGPQDGSEVLGSLEDAELEVSGSDDEEEDEEAASAERPAGGSEEDLSDSEGSDLDPFPEIDAASSESDEERLDVDRSDVNAKSSVQGRAAASNGRRKGSQRVSFAEDAAQSSGEGSDEVASDDAEVESEIEGDYDSDDIDNIEAEEEDDEEDLEKEAGTARRVESVQRPFNKLGLTPEQAAPPLFGSDRNPDGSAAARFQVSKITGQPKRVYPDIEAEYDSDSSTEDAPNRIGNVPLEWYDDLPHIGYDIEGRKVMRPATGDELDKFLATTEDPESWMKAQDKLTGKDIKLTDEELDIIRRLQNAEIPDGSYNPYEPTIEWYTGPGMELKEPLNKRPEPKSRRMPSKWEHKKVMKIVRAIRQGRITPSGPQKQSRPEYYNIWSDGDQPNPDHPMNMPAPKMKPPGHAESYNPPAEYLFDEQERKDWEAADPIDRRTSFLPAKFDALRKVPGYQNFVKERFERCLDLYLAPRMRRERLDLDSAQDLLPKLPSPRELRPFPTMTSVTYPHPGDVRVRCLAVDPRGMWLVTGADDGRVRLWDLAIARCTAVWDLHAKSPKDERAPIFGVQWCPNKSLSLFAASTDGKVAIIVPPQTNGAATSSRGIDWTSPSMAFATQGYQPEINQAAADGKKAPPAKWTRPSDSERRDGIASIVQVSGVPKRVVWHARGDYFATVTTSGQGMASSASSSAVLIHQMSKQRSQAPFARASKGSAVQAVLFHNQQPHFFVATQRTIRVYNLATQTLLKTLQTGLRWISGMHLHGPSGSHLLVSSYDRRVAWFDLDLASRPYKILRYHERAVRAVQFHDRYPLFASVSDDGNAHVLHATIYNDLTSNPLIVPLKVLRGHGVKEGLGILDTVWHPTMPWLLTAGADGQARMWTP